MNPSEFLVSIIVPLYNRGQLVAETLNSVLNQTYTNWECIVVDDGSTDNSIQVVKSYVSKDRRISLLERTQLPKGANKCRNLGLERATGAYVMFLDSDDLLHTHCLERRISKFMANPAVDFIVFNTLLFTESDNLYGYNMLWNVDTTENDLYRFLRIDGVWQTTGPIYKRSFISKFPFDEQLPFLQDLEIAIRILLHDPKYKKYLTEAPDIFIRWHSKESISRTELNPGTKIKQKLAIIDCIHASFANSKYKFRLACQKQFILTYYKLGKEVFHSANTLKDSLAPILKLLKLFPWGYPFFIVLFLEQVSYFFLSRGKGKLIIKTRIVWLKFMNRFIYDSLRMNKPTIYQVKYIA